VIGRLHHIIVDCPDPAELAAFYSALLGKAITFRSDDFCVVADNSTTSGIAFQRVRDFQPPQWPDPDFPQQMHLDVMVNDIATASKEVSAMGAIPLEGGVNVFADPAGHPFCLIARPPWVPEIPSD
jgi:catechol 2,3-dioxygenase-like lactoylglutathione lyase family enzyme